MNEQRRPDGDWNAGAPHFIVDLTLGFSLIIESTDEGVAERNLDTAYKSLMDLLTYQWWFRFPMPTPYVIDANGKEIKYVEIEGVTRGQRKFRFGNASNTNETPVGELQFDLTYRFRDFFLPWPFDDLRRIHVTVAYPWPYDPNAYDPPLTIQYDIPIAGEFSPQPDYFLQSPTFGRPVLTVS
jgi:hypothetical protein